MIVLLLAALLQDQDRQTSALIDQLNRAARAYVAEKGELPKDIGSLIRSGFLLVDAEPRDPWGKPITFDHADGALTIAIKRPERRVSVRINPKTIKRSTSLPSVRTFEAIDAAMRAYSFIQKKPPRSLDALYDAPGVLLSRKRIKGVTVTLEKHHSRIAIPTAKIEPLTDQQLKTLERSIAELASEQFKVREEAGARILELGPAALGEVRKARSAENGLEVQSRLNRIERRLETLRGLTEAPLVVNFYLHSRAGSGLGLRGARWASNQRNAAASIRSIRTAQENFKLNDLDRNGVKDYWTADIAGLYCLQVKTTTNAVAALNDIGVASADARQHSDGYENDDIEYNAALLLTFAPKTGFLYQSMKLDAAGVTYARDTDGGGSKVHNPDSFAVTAYPIAYGSVGVYTFIMNQDGKVYRRDTGGVPVLQWPNEFEFLRYWEEVK